MGQVTLGFLGSLPQNTQCLLLGCARMESDAERSARGQRGNPVPSWSWICILGRQEGCELGKGILINPGWGHISL